jgi:hypothetical protein
MGADEQWRASMGNSVCDAGRNEEGAVARSIDYAPDGCSSHRLH